ncbi:hypothetical protein [Alicyclobacillus sp. ALC3]|uniref:hypothetical protein n=1 Tax=Alicyclobacillus sp. ALC3 TaxID=2796143 RepID=UPI0023797BE9|nr:hypothetical protein [Alicyclobacillus sp. ALC3]WDL95924.1 hypothetical protein JC200_16415 [Alicyclobacillus sp. ALC3]
MHVLLIILIVLLSILVIIIGIIAFLMISVFMTIQPILQFIGKIGLYLWLSEISHKIARRFGHHDKTVICPENWPNSEEHAMRTEDMDS